MSLKSRIHLNTNVGNQRSNNTLKTLHMLKHCGKNLKRAWILFAKCTLNRSTCCVFIYWIIVVIFLIILMLQLVISVTLYYFNLIYSLFYAQIFSARARSRVQRVNHFCDWLVCDLGASGDSDHSRRAARSIWCFFGCTSTWKKP